VEENELCFGLLEARMQAWGVYIAIDEAYQVSVEDRSAEKDELGRALDEVLDRMAEFDRELQARTDLLARIARYPLLENWRGSLGADYREVLPWWLDGRLEEEAETVAKEAGGWLPRKVEFASAFEKLTGYRPFPWQCALYQRFLTGDFPSSCNLPTGLGKTAIIHIWLLALAYAPKKAQVPRRLVYVVNRRTVVDQSTEEARKMRSRIGQVPGLAEQLRRLCARSAAEEIPLAISTLRGEFADNREWSADPTRPAVIVGTVDMIGSRLLFSGYGCGFKSRPLHAGFLGQDVLLVHDEAHLEPAFQDLVKAIESEQKGYAKFGTFRVMELTATSRTEGDVFELTPEEKAIPAELPAKPSAPIHYVWQRMKSKKGLKFHPEKRNSVATRISEIARDRWKDSGKAMLIFVRTIEDVKQVKAVLTDSKKGGVAEEQVRQLTGTMRGLERDALASTDPVFARFSASPRIAGKDGTVYLICTSAGEVGVDISADHMVCDLSTLDSMAQRFGRVNRRGEGAAMIDVVYETDPNQKPSSPAFEAARWETKKLLDRLPACSWIEERHDGSPSALGALMRSLTEDERNAAFAPKPRILPVTDILFDTWALTTIRKLPGRAAVEPYLHGVTDDVFTTEFAWREEVGLLTGKTAGDNIEELLSEFPLKPHETLRVPTFAKNGAYAQLETIRERQPSCPAWVIEVNGDVTAYPTLDEVLKQQGKKYAHSLAERTVILPPKAGGLTATGTLDGKVGHSDGIEYDVAGTPPPNVAPLLRLKVVHRDGNGVRAGRVHGWLGRRHERRIASEVGKAGDANRHRERARRRRSRRRSRSIPRRSPAEAANRQVGPGVAGTHRTPRRGSGIRRRDRVAVEARQEAGRGGGARGGVARPRQGAYRLAARRRQPVGLRLGRQDVARPPAGEPEPLSTRTRLHGGCADGNRGSREV
jgi:CRISPR-associated endonuclease/helicase Cas3